VEEFWQDPYEVLGVYLDAYDEEMNSSYPKKALKYNVSFPF